MPLLDALVRRAVLVAASRGLLDALHIRTGAAASFTISTCIVRMPVRRASFACRWQVRNIALNVAFISITKTTQSLDTTGVAAAAHATTIALWQLGGVVLFAMGSVSTILTSAELGRPASSPREVRAVARRLLSWGLTLGASLGALQLASLPLLRLFTPLAEVRQAARLPSLIGALLQLINGAVFVGEGLMVASGAFAALAAGQVVATASFLLALRLAPPSLVSLWLCFWIFNAVRLLNFGRFFWFTDSPLSERPGGN